jgi:GNAT superfamily N-acetyltransferase
VDFAIERYAGSHRDLEWSFRLAEDSDQALETYIDLGVVWVARTSGDKAADVGIRGVIGHLQAVPRLDDTQETAEEVWEVTSTAAVESHRGHGVGRALLERAVDEARAAGVRRVVLATATADVENLRFYQRCGFRMTRVVHDVFTPDAGYPPGLEVDGIPLLDQVWFQRVL